jgi:proteasome assembly chaperone (PAC2) family protein
MNEIVRLFIRPRLKSPVMLASWPGIGNVSVIVATYLLRKLDFKDLGEIEPSVFFDAIGVVARDNIVEEPQFPQSQFYYWKNKPGRSDIILFIGEDQPLTKGYELANCVLDIAERFKAQRVYTCAAALSRMHHTEQSRVWGVVTSPHMSQELDSYGLAQKGNLQISGLNGLLLGVAKERGMEGICLLGEVPMYATRIQNPVAAVAVLEVLTNEAMEEYIDHFTQPIWENPEEEEEE